MKFKPGDEVFIRAEVTDICPSSERPYFVAPDKYSVNWVSEDKIIPMDKTYSDGLNDAWELAKKIYHAPCEGGLENSEIEEIFDCKFASVTHKYTAAEALAKIEAYERTKEIKVGDVIKYDGTFGVVARVGSCTVNALFEDGITIEMFISECKKTGKHIDIESLLKQIGE